MSAQPTPPQPPAPAMARMAVARRRGIVSLVHGEVLFTPGMPVTEIYLLRSGTVLIFAPSGQTLLRCVAAPGVLGLTAAMAGGRWSTLGVVHGAAVLEGLPALGLGGRIAALPAPHLGLLDALRGA